MKTYIKLFTNDLKNKGLSLYDKAVFGSLTTKFQYHNNSEFYTYEKFIADELEISESSVKRSIKKLAELGLIKIGRRFHKQLNKTVNYYFINLNIEDLIRDDNKVEPDTATTTSEKVEQKPNNKQIEEMQEYIHELEHANDWLQSEVERLENNTNDVVEEEATMDVKKSMLNKAIHDYHEYMGGEYYLQDYFEDWKNLNQYQIEGICGCLGDITKDELTSLYRTWKQVG